MQINIVLDIFMAMLAFGLISSVMAKEKFEKATFAGGCFWCMEPPFEKIDGVFSVVSGYTGGKKDSPTYEEVSRGKTGHLEAIEVTYDPAKVSYEKLLDTFFRSIDPTDAGGQFVDRGSQYMTAIFYHDDAQKGLAERFINDLEGSGKFKESIAVKILKAERFWPAEDYHQDYYRKNADHYNTYSYMSGRKPYLEKTFGSKEGPAFGGKKKGKGSKEELKKKLTPLSFKVTQECGTEPPFQNEYWDNKKEGIYVDIVSGEPLFSSKDKFDSGTGWPSFTKPLEESNIVEKNDRSHGMVRAEVRSKGGDSHLGHLFDDGPGLGGMRYCINSASLRFIPKEELEKEGYGKYSKLFRE